MKVFRNFFLFNILIFITFGVGAYPYGAHLGEKIDRPESDFTALSNLGFSLVRVGVVLNVDESRAGYAFPEKAILSLVRYLEYAKKHNLKIILVLRPPADMKDLLWTQESYRKSLIEIWSSIADRLLTYQALFAYDLINEPHPKGDNFFIKAEIWKGVAVQLIDAIRGIDENRPIIFEVSPGARPLGFRYLTPIPRANIIYSFHYYEPFEFTHQGVLDFPPAGSYDYPSRVHGVRPGMFTDLLGVSDYWSLDAHYHELRHVIDFQQRYQVPVYVGEFGVVRWAPNGGRLRYFGDLLKIFCSQKWSWTVHSFREWYGWDVELDDLKGTNPHDLRKLSRPFLDEFKGLIAACR